MEEQIAFLNYLKDIIFSPNKTITKLSKDKRSKRFITALVVILILEGFLNILIAPSQQVTSSSHTAFLLKRLFDTLNTYSFVTAPLLLFFQVSLQHLLLRPSAKPDAFNKLLVTQGFIAITWGFLMRIIDYLTYLFPQSAVIRTLSLIWLIYLTVISVSGVYKVSKKRAFVVTIMSGTTPLTGEKVRRD